MAKDTMRMSDHQRERLATWSDLRVIQDGIDQIARQKWAQCKECPHIVYGKSFGEILGKLGEHGNQAHPELFADWNTPYEPTSDSSQES